MKIMILGAGLVGAPMAMDLAEDSGLSVSVADISETALKKLDKFGQISTVQCDVSSPEVLQKLAAEYDIFISAVPGFMGFKTLKSLIELEKNVVDIAFFPEDPFLLDDLAKENDVTVIVDCGVAPGMSNILTAHASSQMDSCESVLIYVGGLPVKREWPWEYKAVFSPADVIEEYIRPAYFVENGKRVSRPALSDPEYITLPGTDTLEAFNTDGLRTLATTLNIPYMKEKTLRYPGHIEKINVLRETGFFSEDVIEMNGTKISPLEFTSKMLFPKWKLERGEADITVMQVTVQGMKNGKKILFTYDLLDRYNEKTGVHSMARTTGYTATTVLRMLAKGMYKQKGISPPEYIGKHPECVKYIIKGLKKRGVEYIETIQEG